jgi:hypothetical protein
MNDNLQEYQESEELKFAVVPKFIYESSDTAQNISKYPAWYREGKFAILSIEPDNIPSLYEKLIENYDPVYEFTEDLNTVCLLLHSAMLVVKEGEPNNEI